MDEIEKRLRDASDNCLKCYEAWQKDKKGEGIRESMLETIHELRKVAARLEIEVAVSERDEMAAKPIPIPPHRSSRKPVGHQRQDSQPDSNEGKAVSTSLKIEKAAPRRRKTGIKPSE